MTVRLQQPVNTDCRSLCPYPEGMNGDRLMYFQHTDISRVVFEGYVDDDEIMMCDNIFNAMEKTEIERADVRKLKRSMVN